MLITEANTLLNGKRPLAIVAMLLASLLLIGILGWHSWRLQQSNAAAVESVLREYAILVADEFGRRSTATIGYRGYYQLVTRLDESATASELFESIVKDKQIETAAKLADRFFVLDGNGATTAPGDVDPQMAALLQQVYDDPVGIESPYGSARTASLRQQIIYAKRVADDGSKRLFGFTVNPNGINHHLKLAFDSGPLLPPSLAGGRLANELLFVRVTDPAGATLFETDRQYGHNLMVEKVMGDDYQGILQGFRIEVSVDPNAAATLVIGGLPKSRLPLLLAVMIMAVVLMLSAIWLLRREQAVIKLRSDFLSQVSHELRTPLTQIRMFAETLLLGRTRNEAERRRSLRIIDRESRRLSYLVDNILRFSSISDISLVDRHWQELAPIVREVCDTVQATANGAAIRLDAAPAAHADIDADALHQILLNLLDNALKYGPHRQQVSVLVTANGNLARISVEDQGPGIPVAERERVWVAFYRLKREQKSAISGTGIGLSVVRELVLAMQGRCWIDAPNGGTRVTIEFGSGTDHD